MNASSLFFVDIYDASNLFIFLIFLFFLYFFCIESQSTIFQSCRRNGPNYWNGLSEWTLICGIEYLECILYAQKLLLKSNE